MDTTAYSPIVAREVTITGYLHISIVTVWLWDALTSLSNEVEAFHIKKRRITLADVIYLLARITTGGAMLAIIIHIATSETGCDHAGNLVVAWTGAFVSPLNACLFLIRVDAVFNRNPKLRIAFVLLWLTTFSAFAVPFSFSENWLGSTKRCAIEKVGRIDFVGLITTAMFDTAVFFSITYKIVLSNALPDEYGSRMTSFIRGTGRISSMLLLTGQLYYFPIIVANTVIMATVLSSSVPSQYQIVALVAGVVFQNVLASHVFRLLRIGILQKELKIHLPTITYVL